jgi:ankyrin repeat protein
VSADARERLFQAIGDGDVAVVEACVADLGDANVRLRDESTALAWAVAHGTVEVVSRLLELGADPMAPSDEDGRSVLACGVLHGWHGERSDPHRPPERLWKLLATVPPELRAAMLAPYGGEERARRAGGEEVLNAVAHKLRLVLDAGVRVDARDARGRTALHEAADAGPMRDYARRVTEFLLAEGADPNAADARGTTPLHLAVTTIAKEVVAALLRHGARVDVPDQDGRTPLHLAVATFQDMVEIDPSTGEPDLDQAIPVQEHHVLALLASGADPTAADAAGTTPLEEAQAQAGYPDHVIDRLRAASPSRG